MSVSIKRDRKIIKSERTTCITNLQHTELLELKVLERVPQ